VQYVSGYQFPTTRFASGNNSHENSNFRGGEGSCCDLRVLPPCSLVGGKEQGLCVQSLSINTNAGSYAKSQMSRNY
jgi:hypothetical protein